MNESAETVHNIYGVIIKDSVEDGAVSLKERKKRKELVQIKKEKDNKGKKTKEKGKKERKM